MKTYTYLEMLTILLSQEAGKPSVKFEYDDGEQVRTVWRDTTASNNAFVRGGAAGGEAYSFTEADLHRTYRDYVPPPVGKEAISFDKNRLRAGK